MLRFYAKKLSMVFYFQNYTIESFSEMNDIYFMKVTSRLTGMSAEKLLKPFIVSAVLNSQGLGQIQSKYAQD